MPTPIATLGTGTGTSLGSQGSVVLSPDHQWLLAVNAGSNSVSVFRRTSTGLQLTDVEPTAGMHPISVTIRGTRVYVLNGGMPNSICGYDLSASGQLSPILGTSVLLSAASTNPAQIQLSPLGDRLVVTERGTDRISTFTVAGDGSLHGFVAHPSSGIEPFGFAFRGDDQIVVSEAFDAAPGAGAASSYDLFGGGLSLISGSVPSTETSSCWMVIARDGRFAYTSNTGSDSITGYAINPAGDLTVLDFDGVTALTGDAPADMAFTYRTRFLYVLNGGDGTISAFERSVDGRLTPIQSPLGGLPAGAAGLAAL
jgi:6-phosphogluconolactonase